MPSFRFNVTSKELTPWRLVPVVTFKPKSLKVLMKSLRALSSSLLESVFKDASPSSTFGGKTVPTEAVKDVKAAQFT